MSRNLPRQNRQGRLVAETIVRYRTVDVGGNKIFYREAGKKSKRGRESFLDARGVIAIDAMIKCRVDLVYQLVVLRIMS